MPFACTTNNGVSVVVAEPSIRCDSTDPSYARMHTVASLLLVVFGTGLPASFGALLWGHRNAIYADQLLRVRGEGESALTNPHIHVRRRYRKLYEDFTPNRKYWKLVLVTRKLALACIGILVSGDPALQVPTAAITLLTDCSF